MRATISRGELFAFVRTLGGNPYDTRHIEITHDAVSVTTYLRDEQGNLVAAGGEPATEVARVAIVGDGEAETVRMRHPNLDREVDVPASAVGHHAVAGWEVVPSASDAARSQEGVPYVWQGGQPDQDEPKQPASEEPKTPRRRKTRESE